MADTLKFIPSVPSTRLDFLTTDQMIEVDRLMTDVLEIRLIQMMENAGRNLARLCVKPVSYTHLTLPTIYSV